ncbi:alginate lyase family protein [Vibrio litoralis]|uniref:alginate lyase family protein n=1 Tax=Vibrio litoralis TaxID=335972 RepID=UPI0004172388|nr:alginate lyase family protein [Vibrio litoralis]
MKKVMLPLSLLIPCLAFNATANSDVRFISYDGEKLAENKQQLDKYSLAMDTLISSADKALKRKIDPVVNKTLLPASGNKHDYYSFGPYWWPNPDTKDGLPYIRKDGVYNMDTKTSATDKQRMITFAKDVKSLGLAYYFTGNESYSEKAREQLVAWFVDPDTRMNPNLQYAQAIPGIVDGRGIGIIDSRLLIGVMDSVELIKPELNEDEYKAIVKWYTDFTHWLVTSDNGFEEDNWHNNHGTWFDAQVVAFSIFTNQMDQAKQRLRITQMRRIGNQFDIEGKQHAELERTKPWHYSNFNLEAYNLLGHYGELVDVDVWNYSVDKHSLKNGYKYVSSAIINPESWTYNDQEKKDMKTAYINMLTAKDVYKDSDFDKAVSALQKDHQNLIDNLLF